MVDYTLKIVANKPIHLNFQSNLLDEIDVSNNTLLTLLSCSIVR